MNLCNIYFLVHLLFKIYIPSVSTTSLSFSRRSANLATSPRSCEMSSTSIKNPSPLSGGLGTPDGLTALTLEAVKGIPAALAWRLKLVGLFNVPVETGLLLGGGLEVTSANGSFGSLRGDS